MYLICIPHSSSLFSSSPRLPLACCRRISICCCRCLNFAFVYIKMLLFNGVNSSIHLVFMCVYALNHVQFNRIFAVFLSLSLCVYVQNDGLPSILHFLPSFLSLLFIGNTHYFINAVVTLFAWSHLRAASPGTASQFFRIYANTHTLAITLA